MDLVAHFVIDRRAWSGWSQQQPTEERFEAAATRGQSIAPAWLGLSGSDLEAARIVFPGAIRLMTLLADRVVLEFRHLALVNPNGSIRMAEPFQGMVELRSGSVLRLASPTMDAGYLYTIRLNRINRAQATAPDPSTATPEVSA